MEYSLGFNGLFPLNSWTPLSIILENKGKSMTGILEVLVTSGSEYRRNVQDTTYAMDAELPTNSKKLFSFTLFLDSFTHPLVMRLRDSGGTVLSKHINLRKHYVTKPLLATWQYGPGRGVAFTSDLSGKWGKYWVLWDHYGKFVTQMVRWAQQKEALKNFRAEIMRKWGTGRFTVDVMDNQNRFVNNLDLKVKVLLPSKIDRSFSLDQIAPGRYQGFFEAEEIGEYYLSLYYSSESEGLSRPKIFGYGIPYTDEFYARGVNYALLSRLASLTNGRVLNLEDEPKHIFTAHSEAKEHGHQLWHYLALMSLLILIFDVGIRKFESLS